MDKITFVNSKRNKKVLVYDHHKYHKHYIAGTTAHFKCASQYSGCLSRIKLFGYDANSDSCTDLKVSDKPHNHGLDAKQKRVTSKSVQWAKSVQRTKTKHMNVEVSPCPQPDHEIDLNIVKEEPSDLIEPEDTNNGNRSDENLDDNTEPCLVCGQRENPSLARQRLKYFWSANDAHQAGVLQPHLWAIYILRKLLHLPQQECINLFSKTCGVSNPADWFILCGDCCRLGENAYQLECLINKSEKKLQNVKSELARKLNQSLSEENDGDIEKTVLDTRHKLRSYFKSCNDKNQPANLSVAVKQAHGRSSKRLNSITYSPPPSPEQQYDAEEDDTATACSSSSNNESEHVGKKMHRTLTIKQDEDFAPSPPVRVKKRANPTTEKSYGPRGPYAKEKIFSKTTTGYKCLVCPFTTTKDGQLWHHIKLHRRGKQCDLCKRPTLNEKMLYHHMERFHKGVHTMKPPSKKSKRSTIEVKKDQETINDKPSPPTPSAKTTDGCDNTKGTSSDSSDEDFNPSPPARLKKSTKRTSEKSFGPRGPYAKEKIFSKTKTGYKCLVCPFTTTRDGQLWHHIRLHRRGKQCNLCHRPALNTKMLYFHMERFHQGAHSMDPPPDVKNCQIESAALKTPVDGQTNNPNFYLSYPRRIKKLRPTKTGKRFGPRGPRKTKIFDKTDTGFKCRVCPFLTTREPQMNYHIKLHRVGKHCEVCNHPALNQMKLYHHMEKHHKDVHTMERPLHQCEKCTFECKYLYEMKSHMKNYHQRLESVNVDLESGIYSCKLCPQVFDSELTVLRHIGRDHKVELGLNTYQCHLCEKSFVENNILQTHIRMYHCQDREFMCSVCGLGFQRQIDLVKHSKTHASNEERVICICDSCGLSFQTAGGLRRHKKSIHLVGVPKSLAKEESESTQGLDVTSAKSGQDGRSKRKWNKCSQCGLLCVNFRAAKLHMKEMHPELFQFQCEMCDSKYITARSLLHHKRCVHRKEKGKCDRCGKELLYSSMQGHRKKCNKPTDSL